MPDCWRNTWRLPGIHNNPVTVADHGLHQALLEPSAHLSFTAVIAEVVAPVVVGARTSSGPAHQNFKLQW